MTDPASPKILVVGREIDGSWSVKESAGELLGRFPTNAAAISFAERQRKQQPAISVASSAGLRRRLRGRLTLGYPRGAGGGRDA